MSFFGWPIPVAMKYCTHTNGYGILQVHVMGVAGQAGCHRLAGSTGPCPLHHTCANGYWLQVWWVKWVDTGWWVQWVPHPLQHPPQLWMQLPQSTAQFCAPWYIHISQYWGLTGQRGDNKTSMYTCSAVSRVDKGGWYKWRTGDQDLGHKSVNL